MKKIRYPSLKDNGQNTLKEKLFDHSDKIYITMILLLIELSSQVMYARERRGQALDHEKH
ncbi:hypothetical protein [Legionella tunisiensis]|uniref:hypothetical protein n=1 Tax=Legionella tunisiensis TaxID=1034944 RepID=UPI0012EAFCFD|nr:hypothetical protein [Legionella tunisiensis]